MKLTSKIATLKAEVKTLTCPICGSEFETHDLRRRHCSKECQHRAWLRRMRIANRRHRMKLKGEFSPQ